MTGSDVPNHTRFPEHTQMHLDRTWSAPVNLDRACSAQENVNRLSIFIFDEFGQSLFK